MQYISSEQYIQANKAKYFGDHEAYNEIMGCSTSLECKRASRQIRNVDVNKWDMVAGDLCQPGIQSKFLQNLAIMDTLLRKTGHKTIVECTSDRLWGTGIPINDPDCLDSRKWINQGIIGQILEGIHNNALESHAHPHWSVNPNTNKPPRLAANDYPEPTTQNIGRTNASVLVSMTSIPTCVTTDSGSASTTPVSDTTASDVEIGETDTKQLEIEESLMYENIPAQNK